MSSRWWLATLLALMPLMKAPAQTPSDSNKPRDGVVFLVGGIGGLDPLPAAAQLALPRAGVKHVLIDFVWTHGKGQFLPDLQDADHVRKKAHELAVLIQRHKLLYPEQPIYVIAKSGGTGVVAQAAEELAPATLERVILLSAALSPEFDLRPTLRATRGQVVSFHSHLDQLILNLGTRVFGTIDRRNESSAGLSGFVPPPGLDAEGQALYRRLVQVHWQPYMLLQGYAGLHAGTSFPIFLAVEVAPWLR